MKIYNTYTRKKEDFIPIEENKVRMYVCGPTVYDFIHIGNARPVIFFDIVRRFLTYRSFNVEYVSNITDVDDKIINKAVAEGVSELEISEKYLAQYLSDCKNLNALPLDKMPKVTESITEIVEFIDNLVQNDFAYAVDGDVYFRVKKVDEYGKLSGKKIDDLIAGARVETNDKKEDPLDFTLWKKTDTGITWPSPFGAGRPGWHTECVVMINDVFNGKIDIHGGGSDLQFPHHENEIAQSICASGHEIANVWMHVGRLGLDDEKMSKSIGNVILVKDLLREWDVNVFKLFMISTHYRQPINFSYDVLTSAKIEWEKISQTYHAVKMHNRVNNVEEKATDHKDVMQILSNFNDAMEDDFNTANAVTEVFALVKLLNVNLRAKNESALVSGVLALEVMLNVLGLVCEFAGLTDEDVATYHAWIDARNCKDFALADELRAKLQEKGLL